MEIDKRNLSENQKLADYVKKNLKKGYDPDTLKYALLSQGYSRTSVEKAVEIAQKQLQYPANSEKVVSAEPSVYNVMDEDDMYDIKRKVELEPTPGFFAKLKRKFFD